MSAIDGFEVTGVVWVDEDGTRYERKFVDGEIVDEEL